jgi:hypothetical protein
MHHAIWTIQSAAILVLVATIWSLLGLMIAGWVVKTCIEGGRRVFEWAAAHLTRAPRAKDVTKQARRDTRRLPEIHELSTAHDPEPVAPLDHAPPTYTLPPIPF